jgi:hypothetical protein
MSITRDNRPRDFMAQGERRFGNSGHAVIEIPEVSVAYSATGDFDQYLSGFDFRYIKTDSGKCPRYSHLPGFDFTGLCHLFSSFISM